MKSLVNYLEDSFAITLSIKAISRKVLAILPLYLSSSYTFYEGDTQNRKMIFVEPEKDLSLTPEQKQKQAHQLREFFKLPIVFILNNLESWERKRLIARNIAFVQPGRQLYIPEILMDLNDVKYTDRSAIDKKEQLSYRTQLAVLYHLEIKSIENTPLQDVARALNYSAMAVSRISKELEQHELITVKGAKHKQIIFNQRQSDKLWLEVEPLMRSPVRDVEFLEEIPAETSGFLWGNDTALSQYSDINEGKIKSYAIEKKLFKELLTQDLISFDPHMEGSRVEVWHYDPCLLSKKEMVDPLSLYLSMRNEEDERVKIALDKLLTEIKW